MKKHLRLTAALLALLLCLTGCFPFSSFDDRSSVTLSETDSSRPSQTREESSKTESSKETETAETSGESESSEAAETGETSVGESSLNESSTQEASSQESSSQESSESLTTPTGEGITDYVVLDNEYVTFTIKSGYSDLFGYNLKVTLENKTDKNLNFTWADTVIDGYSCDPFFYSTVAAGKKANDEINFYSEDLKEAGVSAPSVLTFTLHVFDDDDWSADYLVDERFTVYPFGEAAAKEPKDIPAEDAQKVLYEDSNIRVYMLDAYTDSYGFNVSLYLVNYTDSTLMFSINNASVNGFMVEPFWSDSVPASARDISTVTWYKSDLEENDIATVEDVEFTLRVYNYDDWFADDLLDQTFSFTVGE